MKVAEKKEYNKLSYIQKQFRDIELRKQNKELCEGFCEACEKITPVNKKY